MKFSPFTFTSLHGAVLHGAVAKQTNLVVTNLPPGKRFYATPGHSEDPKNLLAYAKCCGDLPSTPLEAVSAESVGLEWHIDGEKMNWSEEYRKNKYVLLTEA